MKIVKLPVPNCIISDYFKDANDPEKERLRYCQKNCNYKCLNGLEYKKCKGALLYALFPDQKIKIRVRSEKP